MEPEGDTWRPATQKEKDEGLQGGQGWPRAPHKSADGLWAVTRFLCPGGAGRPTVMLGTICSPRSSHRSSRPH